MKSAKQPVQIIINYLHTAIRMQIFITLVALPILVLWGLPISALTIVGNIIFAPLLSCFLLLSSLIFFAELMYLPNGWCIALLEKLTVCWLKISPSNPKSYFLFFPQTTWLVFVLALGLAIYIIAYYQATRLKRLLLLSLLLFMSCIIAKLPFWLASDQVCLQYRKKKMLIYYQDGALAIHDYGILNYYCGIENWLQYHLTPTLIKQFGTLHVKNLYLHSHSKSTPHNLELMQQNMVVEKVHKP